MRSVDANIVANMACCGKQYVGIDIETCLFDDVIRERQAAGVKLKASLSVEDRWAGGMVVKVKLLVEMKTGLSLLDDGQTMCDLMVEVEFGFGANLMAEIFAANEEET